MRFPTLTSPGDPPAIGINIDGVLEHDGLPTPDAATRFAWIRDCGAFDYIEKNIDPSEDFAPWFDLVERHGVPISVFGGIFRAGADEALMRQGLATGGRLGARLFNIQLHDRHADGHRLSDEEVARFYADAFEHGQRSGCLPSFEVHVDMWNERFHRVEAVAERLARSGLPMRLTLDPSHLIFKIDDPAELALSEIDGELDGGRTWLAPGGARCLWRRWLDEGWVVHAHARSVATGPGPNPLTRRRDGRPGRSIQYPFVRPQAGTFPGIWEEDRLAVWKRTMHELLDDMRARPDGTPRQISCEFIPFPDYGGGLRCSIMDSNLACAAWLRQAWGRRTPPQAAPSA